MWVQQRLLRLRNNSLQVSLFDFELPSHLIAAEALLHRDASRMLVLPASGMPEDHMVRQLPDFLKAGDVLVLNNTKVIPARLRGLRGDVHVKFLLHQREAEGVWRAFAKPAKRLKIADVVQFAEGYSGVVAEKYPDGQIRLDFSATDADVLAMLHKIGEMPLPPYIEKIRKTNAADTSRYQTIFADAAKEASVAAPTAGLHFTEALLQAIREKGVRIEYVTLHVGAGTFLPVKVEDTSEHVMHSEYAEISASAAANINDAKARGGRVVAVGTTSLRALESAAVNQKLKACQHHTQIFITPGYEFQIVDVLLTNFHLPKSTLLMLVSAFAGRENILRGYQHAIDQQYRFYSYGDACLLFKAPMQG